MTIKRMVFFLAAILFCVNLGIYACTTFTLNDNGHMVYGRNLDWYAGSGLIIVNQRNVSKKAIVIPRTEREVNPAIWVSKYGSVTFNGLAREFPMGGINEAGLVVDTMWLNETKYLDADARSEMDIMQWIQYLLDTCKTIDDVIDVQSNVRVSHDCVIPSHFLIADKNGKTAAIEFLGGELVIHSGSSLHHAILTNNTYTESAKYLKQHRCFGGNKEIQQGEASLDRFVRAANMVKEFTTQKKELIPYAFDILHDVNQGYDLDQHSTMWSIVCDITNMQIHYRTHAIAKFAIST